MDHGALRVLLMDSALGEIRSIEHAQDSLVQACAVVLIGVAMMGNKKALFVTFVDRVPRFEAY
jgi:hypothetical protein